MGAGDWFRALQVPVLPVSVGPAVVGSLLGAQVAGALDVSIMVLTATSLCLVQVGANLHKGITESADLVGVAERPRSPFSFDAGAVQRLGLPPGALLVLMRVAYGAGAGAGLLVVVLARQPILLAFGAAGAFFAYSYSGPPLKLSYRGVGEVATFLAFGPLTVLGAAIAQAPALVDQLSPSHWQAANSPVPLVLLVGSGLGFLAAMISFARYFPAAAEDAKKGKRTPVVRFGPHAGHLAMIGLGAMGALCFWMAAGRSWAFHLCTSSPAPGPQISFVFVTGYLLLAAALATLAVGTLAALNLKRPEARPVDAGVAAVVGLHFVVSAILAVAMLGLDFLTNCP